MVHNIIVYTAVDRSANGRCHPIASHISAIFSEGDIIAVCGRRVIRPLLLFVKSNNIGWSKTISLNTVDQ